MANDRGKDKPGGYGGRDGMDTAPPLFRLTRLDSDRNQPPDWALRLNQENRNQRKQDSPSQQRIGYRGF